MSSSSSNTTPWNVYTRRLGLQTTHASIISTHDRGSNTEKGTNQETGGRFWPRPSTNQQQQNHRWMDGLMENPAASYCTTQWHESNLALTEDTELERAFRLRLRLFAHVCLCVLLYWPGSVVWSLQLDSVCTDEELHLRGGNQRKRQTLTIGDECSRTASQQ